MRQTSLTIALSAVLVGGCATPYSEAPLATNFATIKQNKLQAGAHWQSIADDLAKTVTGKIGAAKVIYLNAPASSAFTRAFHSQLLTALVNSGVQVAKSPADADVTVDIETQTVKFGADRTQYGFVGVPTALAAGVWVLYGVEASVTAVGVATATAALVAFDAVKYFRSEYASGPTPQNEIFVTVTVSDKNRYLARTSNVYYVAESDAGLYALTPPPPPFKTLQVKGDR